jgi:hypothetical protein
MKHCLVKHCLVIGGALLGFAAIAPAAGAYPLGGSAGGSIGIHSSMSSSLGDVRRNAWKKPFDSDGGGPGDPAPATTGKGNGTTAPGGTHSGPRHTGYPHNPQH